MWTVVTLFVGTLLSEDLACIGAGLLVRRGIVSPVSAVFACVLGIFLGDMGLWMLGRLVGQKILTWRRVAHRLRAWRIDAIRSWIEAHAGRSIVASRFLPGTRLPLYVLAGTIGLRGTVFGAWAALGAILWTPAVVLLTAVLSDAFSARLSSSLESPALADGALVLTMLLLLYLARLAGGRQRLAQAD
jgi:membrane protein DedA with SNARE-associated domain